MLTLRIPLSPSGSQVSGNEIARGVANTDPRVIATIRRRLHFVDFITRHAANGGLQSSLAANLLTQPLQGPAGGLVSDQEVNMRARCRHSEKMTQERPNVATQEGS